MDKEKILRLCNQIEMIINTVCNTGYTLQPGDEDAIFNRTKAIVAEINTPPKTNADHIRQMTDEELAEFLSEVKNYCIKIPCGKCYFYDAESSVDDIICNPLRWIKQEVIEDVGTD